jgi:hypothetical protein
MKPNLSARSSASTAPELCPPGSEPHIAVAPGLLDRAHKIIREPGESDERYEARCELLDVLVDFAKQIVKPKPLSQDPEQSDPSSAEALVEIDRHGAAL